MGLAKEFGGLGLRFVEVWNKATLLKQLWVLPLKKDHLWVQWIHAYYIKDSYLMRFQHPKNASWILRKILALRDHITTWGGWRNIILNQKFFIGNAYLEMMGQHQKAHW